MTALRDASEWVKRLDKNATVKILKRLLSGRLRPLIALFGLVSLIVFGVWVALAFLRPIPQRSVVMAVYPEGSLNAEIVKRYRDILARNGIDLTLQQSAGAVDVVMTARTPPRTARPSSRTATLVMSHSQRLRRHRRS
jgi:hypothetical protein